MTQLVSVRLNPLGGITGKSVCQLDVTLACPQALSISCVGPVSVISCMQLKCGRQNCCGSWLLLFGYHRICHNVPRESMLLVDYMCDHHGMPVADAWPS